MSGEIGDGEVDVQRGEQRQEVEHLARAVQVRQVEGDHLDVRESPPQRLDPGVVRPVAAPDKERALVEPERVAALGERRSLEPRGDRDARPLPRSAAIGVDFHPTRLLPRPQENGAVGR